jgi:hypothetical protein
MFKEAIAGQAMTRHDPLPVQAPTRYYSWLSLQSLGSTFSFISQLCLSLTSAMSPQSQFLVPYCLIKLIAAYCSNKSITSQRLPFTPAHSQTTLVAYRQILIAAYRQITLAAYRQSNLMAYRQTNLAAYRQLTQSLFHIAAYHLRYSVRPAAPCPTFQKHPSRRKD